MIQAKFSLEKSHVQFLNQFQLYGFKDKSEIVRIALSRLQRELERQSLQESAALYAQIYEEDAEIKELTESALLGWPE
jgi:Arc/MetJ-type ribon-helix-helix transcriptional regulator